MKSIPPDSGRQRTCSHRGIPDISHYFKSSIVPDDLDESIADDIPHSQNLGVEKDPIHVTLGILVLRWISLVTANLAPSPHNKKSQHTTIPEIPN